MFYEQAYSQINNRDFEFEVSLPGKNLRLEGLGVS